MEYNNFEKHISETLRHDEVKLDINALIQDIHGEKPRRRIPLWLWFSTALTLSGFLASYLYFNRDVQYSETIKNNLNSADAKNITKSIIPSNNEKSEINSSLNTSLVLSVDAENIKTPHTFKDDRKQNKSPLNKDLSKANRPYKKQNFYRNDNHPFPAGKNESIIAINEPMIVEGGRESIKSIVRDELSMSPMPYELHKLYSGKPGKIKSKNVYCPTFSKKGKYFFEVIPEIGYFRPIKKLEQVGNEPDNIFALRNTNETTLEGLNAGLYLRMGKEKLPFFFQVGASISRMTEKMPLDYSYTRRDTTRGIISITQSQTGDTLTVIFGDIVQETKISGKKTNHHHFTLIDLPISAGYEKRFGQWAAGIEAGVVLNMSLRANGQILASDTSFTAIDVPVQAYRNKLGMSYFGGLYLSKDFYNAGRFFVSLRGRYIPGTFSTEQNRIKQSYHFLGLNLGYVYTF